MPCLLMHPVFGLRVHAHTQAYMHAQVMQPCMHTCMHASTCSRTHPLLCKLHLCQPLANHHLPSPALTSLTRPPRHRPPSPSTQATVTASAPGLAPAAPATAPTIAAVSGRIHSQESMSAVDGPGLRYMIFEQGCGLRCLFCCNPDTFPCGEGHGTPTSSKELAARISRVAPYLRPSGGVRIHHTSSDDIDDDGDD